MTRPRISTPMSGYSANVINNAHPIHRSANHRCLSNISSHQKTGKLLQEEHEDDMAGELHSIESGDSYNLLYLPHTIRDLNENCEPDTLLNGTPNISAKSKKKTSKQPSKKKLSADKKQAEADQFRQKLSNLNLEEAIKSYTEMCFHLNIVPKALSILRYNHENKQLSREVYDAVLKESAEGKNWGLVKHILSLMRERDIPMNLHSFAHCFECLGRLADSSSNSEFYESISKLLVKKLSTSGYEAQSIFDHCKMTDDNLKFTVMGVKLALPEFTAIKHPSLLTYSSNLLQDLNDFSVEHEVKSPAKGIVTMEQLFAAADEQLSAELNGTVEIQSISHQGSLEDTLKLKNLENEWEKNIEEALERDLAVSKTQFMSNDGNSNRSMHIYPYLCALSNKDYVSILMEEVQMLSRTSDHYSPSINTLSRSLGQKVMQKFHIKKKQKNGVFAKVKSVYHQYCEWYLNPTQQGRYFNPRQHWQRLLEENSDGPTIQSEDTQWPVSVLHSVGNFLYCIILNDLKIEAAKSVKHSSIVPAFYVVFRTKGLKTRKEIKPHPSLIKYYLDSNHRKLSFDTSTLPMLSPPMPWNTYQNGGYLLSLAPLVRLPFFASQQKTRLQDTPYRELYPSLDALNFLGTIPWKINERTLDLIIHIYNSKGSKEFGVPQPPPDCSPLKSSDSTLSPVQKSLLIKERHAQRRLRAEMFSLWMDTLYRLSLANHFRNRIFWLPHNMDFRGRVYPCSPHLTHLSSDMIRSILLFAQGKPLGKGGLDWLKIHLINLTGLKKREPVSKRLEFANEVMPEILDSANNPLDGKRWWLSSDEPWQTLAACIEVSKAIKYEDPSTYICHLPIHQDGSCNGLQHYAALGRDQAGAESVNLAPADRPQDVYSNVAELVEKERVKDAAEGNLIAQILEGKVSRKVVKQTVMTTVYGVTRFGARLQIAKQLKENIDIPAEHVAAASLYLVGKTFLSLQEMFASAKEIQDWFTECARLISTVGGDNVEWITPLGLPVVQPYSKNPSMDQPHGHPITMKHRNAFPPNFIHSLDSSHMMLTALYSQRSGITFASVHDCFWTHPSTVDTMNKICRNQFVALHSQPILEDLSRFLIGRHGFNKSEIENEDEQKSKTKNTKHRLNKVLTAVPKRGNFDLRQVLESVYFFS